MQALLLCSGTGSRLRPHTDDKPKCLVEVGGMPMLQRLIESLEASGVHDLIITTGPFANDLRAFIGRVFQHLRVQYVHCPNYENENYIVSMHNARHLITGDVLTL